ERLRRSVALEPATIADFHDAVVSERDEVSAVTRVSLDDAGTGAPGALDARLGHAANPSRRARLRSSAAVLFRPAPHADPSARGRGLRSAVRRGALDVRIADARSLSIHAAAGMGILAADRVRRVDIGRGDALPRVRVVRRRQGTAT